jgi:prepilin-type N-terminal cleavage/methylation domain-containing protein
MNKQRGFTIIELIVVIAIIAILAAIVLVNVTVYINKAKDARINSDIANLALNEGACYGIAAGNGTGTYVGCEATAPTALAADISSEGGTIIVSEAVGSYVLCSKMASDNTKYTCVDSTGVTKNNDATACTTSSTTCP